MSCGRSIGLQSARIMLQYSANARDVHMLRSVPERLCVKAAELFDNAIMTALAVMFEQAQVPKEMAYCDADPDKHVYPIFNLQRGRLGLPTYMAGVGLRAWREHRHAAFVGMVAQSCASAQLQFGGVTRCAYPALTWLGGCS